MPCSQPKTIPCESGSSNKAAREAAFVLSDQVEYLASTQKAYEAVERLVTPVMLTDDQRLDIDRTELSALLLVLNRAMRQDLEATMEKAKVLITSFRQH